MGVRALPLHSASNYDPFGGRPSQILRNMSLFAEGDNWDRESSQSTSGDWEGLERELWEFGT